jgi:hypothetical protein
MESVEQLQKIATEAQAKLWEIEHAKRRKENGSKVGKTFRTQNNYSCPEKPSDYWWLYAKVTRMDDDGLLYATTFQTDKYGNVDIKYDELVYHMQHYSQCPATELNRAWRALLRRVHGTFQ